MDEAKKQEIAAFRYGLISGVVNRLTPLEPGEITTYFRDVSKKTFQIPESNRKSVSIRTLERYKALYEQHGLDGLLPKSMPKRGVGVVDQPILETAARLRKERPERSVEQIIFTLEKDKVIESGKLSASTLSRYLRSNGLSRKQLIKSSNSGDSYKRFEAAGPNCMWQSDFKHAVYLPDPLSPGRKKKTKLCAIMDDYSRYIVHGQFYWDEKLPVLEDSLKKAILKHGIVEQFYCDNGSAFSTKHLSNICARLGIRLSHSQIYRPAGRGKIERIFQFIDSSFIPEAYVLIEKGQMTTLEELNKAFQIWLEGYYHQRKHGSTGETPEARYKQITLPKRHLPIDTLTRMFFVAEQRQVDKAGCISLNGMLYEVGPELAGQKIEARYDAFDPNVVEIWYSGIYKGQAKVLNVAENFNNFSDRKQTRPSAKQAMTQQTEFKAAAQNEVPAFLEAAKNSMTEAYEQLSMSYIQVNP